MKFTKILIAATVALAPFAAHAQIADGGFEAKGAAGTTGGSAINNYCYDAGSYGDGVCASGSAWTGTSGVVRSGNGPWGSTAAAAGDYFAFVQGGGVLSQTFTVANTGSFVLSWLDAGRANLGAAQSYTVSVTGSAGTIDLGTFTTDHTDWQSEMTDAFLLDAGTYTLSFSGLAGLEDRTSFIDNVSMAGVPEPAAWGMMIGGFGLAGMAMRRRRSADAAHLA